MTSSRRVHGGAILVALFVHVVCSAVAIARYPGGTWCDRGSDGHSLWANFLCDLLHAHALNGQNNPGAGLARVSMLALIAAFAIFWAAVGRDAVPNVAVRALRVAALFSVLGMIAVPLLASDRFPRGHGVAVMLAGGPGFLAMILSVGIVFEQGARKLATVGALAIVIAIVDMALYVKSYFRAGDCVPLLPVLQRIALFLVLGFLAGVALRSFETDERMR